jgi:DNA repair exonuclease SbcCD ATPase subunit
MRYTALILKRFKRFALNQIDTFTIRPTEQVQLILGTNGSGKSSLVGELTPLPANASDYMKDGSKEVHITDRGHSYICVSDFAVKQIHSFRKDGEELNPGGTAAVQKELCRQEFGITPNTQELALGLVRFTDMGPSQRREWFTELSDVRYDYAIGVYNRLREKYRDTSGALKLDKKQLVIEQSKIITEEEIQHLVKDVKELHTELSRLFEMRAPIVRTIEMVNADRARAQNELMSLSQMLLNMRVESPAHLYRNDWGELVPLVFSSIDDVQDHIDDIRQQISAQEALLSKLVTDHDRLKKTVEILKKQGAEGIESVRTKIRDAAEVRMSYLRGMTLKLDFMAVDPFQAVKTIESIRQDTEALLHELPSNESKLYSSAKLQELKEALDTLKRFLRQKQHELAVLQAKKQHSDEHKASGSITCPKCNHIFTKGMSEVEYVEIGKRMDLIGEEITGTEKNIKMTEELVANQENYGALYRQFIQLTRSTPSLKPFWDYAVEKELPVKAPRAIINLIGVVYNDLELECKAKLMNDEIDELKKLLAQSEQLGDANLSEAEEKLGVSNQEIEALTRTLSHARRELNDFHIYRKQLAEAISTRAQIEHASDLFEALTNEAVETLRRQTIQQCIQQTQSTLARKEEILNAVKQQKAIVENLSKIITQRTKEEEALKATVRALSPTDGLIAEGLLGFIKNFTHQMNGLIRKIWAYPLEVLPCGVANERGAELDYKFPLMVGTRDNIVVDVSRGSSGMQEIVDLGFKVIALKYLHLENGALMLDEFGKTLDLEHRTAAVMAIKTLMDTKPFTQLFMISHYESHYGAFSNAEVCVLDARNIAVPKTYNTHVTMH